MNDIKFLSQPVNPYFVSQRFGEKGACINNTTRKVVSSNNGVCPTGTRSLYPSGGHTGLDQAAGNWQKVYAATEGIVEEKETEEARGLGLGIITETKRWCVETGQLEHMKHRYWHFIAIDVDLGEKVEVGQLIGYADNTGYSSGDHLHFELKPVRQKKNGTWYNVLQENGSYGAINPAPYIQNRFALDMATILRQLREVSAQLADLIADLIRYGKIS